MTHRWSFSARPLQLSLVGLLFVLGACGGGSGEATSAGSGEATSAGSQENSTVTVEGIAFLPRELTVEVGDTVEWVNKDEVDHTVTSGEAGEQGVPGVDEGTPPEPDGLFDDELKRAGSTSSFTFDEPGTFIYFCRVHASMTGVVTVE